MNNLGLSIFAIFACLSVAWAAKTCKNNLDLVLVVEDTSSLPLGEAETLVKTFLAAVANHLTLGEEFAHVALQFYNDQSRTEFNLNRYAENADAVGAIEKANFERKALGKPLELADALNYTLNNVLRVANGERSCYPTVIVVLSYSSYIDPNANGNSGGNGRESDVSLARQLRNSGALILTVGVGPNRDPAELIAVAGNANNYYDVRDFSDLSQEVADAVALHACDYKLSTDFYPCEMETIDADLTFVVDVSTKMTKAYSGAVTSFIANLLRPYRFTKDTVRAAFVTYHKVAEVVVHLNDNDTYDKFTQQVNTTLSGSPYGTERYIYNALDNVRYHVLSQARPGASHFVFVFTADCFTGPDPAETAQAIRAADTHLYLISLGSPFGFWKETLDITGGAQSLYEVPLNPEVVLPNFLPRVGWRVICAAQKPAPPPPSTSSAAPTASSSTASSSAASASSSSSVGTTSV